jgi:hypothetical protein
MRRFANQQIESKPHFPSIPNLQLAQRYEDSPTDIFCAVGKALFFFGIGAVRWAGDPGFAIAMPPRRGLDWDRDLPLRASASFATRTLV